MKRTKKPQHQQNIKKQDIELQLIDQNQSLALRLKIKNLSQYCFDDNAQVILEMQSQVNFKQFNLGDISVFLIDEFIQTIKDLPSDFLDIDRKQIWFKLKVIDPINAKLLGLADNLKEKNYSGESLIDTKHEEMSNVFKLDWRDWENPVLVLNSKLSDSARAKIEPLMAEAVYREILIRLLLDKDIIDDGEDLEGHKWIRFADIKLVEIENMHGWNDILEKIETIVGKASVKQKLIKELNKGLQV